MRHGVRGKRKKVMAKLSMIEVMSLEIVNYAFEMQGYFYSTFTTFRRACENSFFFLFFRYVERKILFLMMK